MSKKIVTIGIAVVLACVVFVGVCANLSFVNAETLSDEAYTSSDHLLNANGTTETKTIQNFAEEVKAAANNDEVSRSGESYPDEISQFLHGYHRQLLRRGVRILF